MNCLSVFDHFVGLALKGLTISEQEVKKIHKELSTEKSTGVNMMSPKFVKLPVNYLARSLSQSNNNSIKKGFFPKNEKVASVTPIDKKTNDKSSLLKLCPISVFNCLSKVYENILKTNCIRHDHLNAKLAANEFDNNMICYIYSYLKIRKQCVTVNNIKGSFVETISGVLQGSVVVPILFNIFFNDFFYKYLNYFTEIILFQVLLKK